MPIPDWYHRTASTRGRSALADALRRLGEYNRPTPAQTPAASVRRPTREVTDQPMNREDRLQAVYEDPNTRPITRDMIEVSRDVATGGRPPEWVDAEDYNPLTAAATVGSLASPGISAAKLLRRPPSRWDRVLRQGRPKLRPKPKVRDPTDYTQPSEEVLRLDRSLKEAGFPGILRVEPRMGPLPDLSIPNAAILHSSLDEIPTAVERLPTVGETVREILFRTWR